VRVEVGVEMITAVAVDEGVETAGGVWVDVGVSNPGTGHMQKTSASEAVSTCAAHTSWLTVTMKET
jgi:hypothetical protein